MSVRARVSAASAERVAPLLGTSSTRLLDGTLIANGTDTVIVEVPTAVRATVGASLQTLHQRVSIPRTELLELETRKLDRLRTGALVASAAVIVGAVVIRSINGGPASGNPPGGGGPGEFRAPLWRLSP
jgi:hypothetical protein